MKLRRIDVLPSLLTLGNLFCGFLAIAYVADAATGSEEVTKFHPDFVKAAWMIFLAMAFDALDGKVARMTNATSDFGKQLDSLSDMITFGVAPAFLVKVLVLVEHSPYVSKVAWGMSVLFVSCAALRLARYNVETSSHEEGDHEDFRGLPSPAAAGTIASLVILYGWLGESRLIVLLLPPVTVLLGALMISRFQYAHAFNRIVKGNRSFTDLAQIVFILIFGALEPEITLALLFAVYTLSAPVRQIFERRPGRRTITVAEEEERPSAQIGG